MPVNTDEILSVATVEDLRAASYEGFTLAYVRETDQYYRLKRLNDLPADNVNVIRPDHTGSDMHARWIRDNARNQAAETSREIRKVGSFAELREVPTAGLADGVIAYVRASLATYLFDLQAYDSDDNADIIKPNDRLLRDGGRWVKEGVASEVTAPIEPDPVDALTVTADDSLEISLAWPAVVGAESIQLDRKTDGGPFKRIATLAGNATSHSDTVPAAGTYTYRIRVRNEYIESAWVTADPVTVPQEAPAPSENLLSDPFDGSQANQWTTAQGSPQFAGGLFGSADGPQTFVIRNLGVGKGYEILLAVGTPPPPGQSANVAFCLGADLVSAYLLVMNSTSYWLMRMDDIGEQEGELLGATPFAPAGGDALRIVVPDDVEEPIQVYKGANETPMLSGNDAALRSQTWLAISASGAATLAIHPTEGAFVVRAAPSPAPGDLIADDLTTPDGWMTLVGDLSVGGGTIGANPLDDEAIAVRDVGRASGYSVLFSVWGIEDGPLGMYVSLNMDTIDFISVLLRDDYVVFEDGPTSTTFADTRDIHEGTVPGLLQDGEPLELRVGPETIALLQDGVEVLSASYSDWAEGKSPGSFLALHWENPSYGPTGFAVHPDEGKFVVRSL